MTQHISFAPFAPFADDTRALTLGSDFSLENGTDAVTLSGTLVLTKDQLSLAQARALRDVLDQLVSAIEQIKDLPEKTQSVASSPVFVKNPF